MYKYRNIAIRKKFSSDGYIKISRLTPQEIKIFIEIEKNKLEEEMQLLKSRDKLLNNLNKLRSVRNERKGML